MSVPRIPTETHSPHPTSWAAHVVPQSTFCSNSRPLQPLRGHRPVAVHPNPTSAAGERPLPPTCPTLSLSVLQRPSCSPRPPFSHVCPNAWVGFQGKCYYFSDTESDWNSSREHCHRLGASLATIETEEEMVRAGREPQCQHGDGKCALCGAAQTPLGAPYWPHAKAVRRCLWRKHRAVLGQCQVLISPPPCTLLLLSLSAHIQGRALSTPLPTQHCTNMSAAPCSEVGPEMWGGDGMCSNGSNHTWFCS